MTRPSGRIAKLRRLATLAAAAALAVTLSGCVVYPAGPGYGYYHPYYWHGEDHDWHWHH